MLSFCPSRTRSRRLLILVLSALLLRLLIPAGYMPLAAGGGPMLGLCPGDMALSAGRAQHGGHPHGEHVPCLFAASAAPAFSPPALALPLRSGAAAPPAAAAAATLHLPSILRSQTPRGPPAAARYS
jgi:hypothetical protein